MSNTTLLDLPLLEAAQAQKHITHNEALQVLDILTMPAVADKDLTSPPGSPAEGDRYIVAASATGGWTGHEASIAAYQDGVWRFYAPNTGWAVWVDDEAGFYIFDGTAWIASPSGGGGGGVTTTQLADGTITQVGVNAASDTTNRLSVNSDAVLFNHNGSDSRVIVNKSGTTDTASHLFQTGFSGRAEFGLTGSDDFQVKVSSDGTNWTNAFTVNRASGVVTFHQGIAGGSAGENEALKTSRINQAHGWFHLLSANNLPILNIAQGFVDVFEDESGVDTATSTDETYDASGEYYHNGGESQENVSSAAGSSTVTASYTLVDRSWAVDNGAVVSKLRIYATAAFSGKAKICLENSSTNFDVVVDESISHTGSGWEEFTLTSPYAVPASGTYRIAAYSSGASAGPRRAATLARSYKSGDITGAGQTGFVADNSGDLWLLGVVYSALTDFTLVSSVATAAAEPGTINVVLQHEPVDSVTLNTDCTIEVSIDGGTTWATGTLEIAASNNGVNILAADDIDVSSQTGTSVKYRFKTLNSKSQKLHAIALNWK